MWKLKRNKFIIFMGLLFNMRGAKGLGDYDRGLLICIRMLRNVANGIRHRVLAIVSGAAV